MKIDPKISAAKLLPAVRYAFDLSAEKLNRLESEWDAGRGSPVFTIKGRYTTRGWTEWTEGFHYGSLLLQFDATGTQDFLELGWRKTVQRMARHVSHIGVHDHGFNNVSTYGNLWRLMREGRMEGSCANREFCELGLKVSGAVQASRWTALPEGGYIYSFNGPHSLFVDTIRSLRSLAIAHQLGHVLMGEQDSRISLLERLLEHGRTTAAYAIYYGKGRDTYDVRGRTAHESIFNPTNGSYRCPGTQQGYSPFSTWTRGLAWAILGFSEQLEYLDTFSSSQPTGTERSISDYKGIFLEAARATADFYIENSCLDGIPLWDAGAPNAWRLGNYLLSNSDPFNDWEPVDSSAAAIAAQGLLRLGNFQLRHRKRVEGTRYRQAGLTILRTLLSEPYLSTDKASQGLLLHSIYHRPNGWDATPPRRKIPAGESSMWGDYHLRELCLLILREATNQKYLTFFEGR